MKNYSIKKYILFLLVCLFVGCASSQKADTPEDNLVLDVDEVVTIEDNKIEDNKTEDVSTVLADIRGFKISRNLQFEYDSAALTAETREKLLYIVDELDQYPDALFQIVGHACDMGNERHNMILSKNRAQAVKNALHNEYGINNHMEVFGKGSSEPAESNDTISGKEANRRVEIYVVR